MAYAAFPPALHDENRMVWGMGATPAEALADVYRWLDNTREEAENDEFVEQLRTFEMTPALEAAVTSGRNDADILPDGRLGTLDER